MTEREQLEAAKRMYLSMKTKRALSGFPSSADHKEVVLELLTATAVMLGSVPEEQALRIFTNCLRWVRGEAKADEPTPPTTLN